MTDPSQPDTERLAGALLACLAPLTQILDHMARAPGSTSVEASAAVLQGLLMDTLGPMSERRGAEAVLVTTDLLVEATDVIVDELRLVPHMSEP
jgi:hypothetical protein